MAILKANSTVNNQSITGNTATLSVSSTPGSSNVTTRVLSKSYDGQLIWSDLHPLAAVNIYTPVFQGSQSGYFSSFQTTDYSVATEIEKFSFSTESPSTGVGNLTSANPTYNHSGHSSASDGYVTGGATNTGPPNYTTTYLDSIQKFPFSSDSDASDVGELTVPNHSKATVSSDSHGYVTGGYSNNLSDTIEKFPFSSDSPSSDIGELPYKLYQFTGVSSTTKGYFAGGYTPNILTPSPSDTPSAQPTSVYRTEVNSIYYSSDTPATFTLNTIKSVTSSCSGGSHQI